MSKQIYMDYAAATPMDERVLKAMQPYFSERFYNPSSVYLASREIKQDLGEAREVVAHWLGARPTEITFTAGATEANNLVIAGVLDPDSHVVTSAIEHEAVLEPSGKYSNTVVGVDERGMVDADKLAQAIQPNTKLVSVIYANNEIGTVQHLSELSKVIKEERENRFNSKNKTPIYLHTDASQAPNFLDLHVDKLGVDLMTLNGGKIYGPKQSGALYVRAGIELKPMLLGGGQEHGIRSGTENVAAAIGFARALEIAQKQRKLESKRLMDISSTLMKKLETTIEDIEFLGHMKNRIPNIMSVIMPGIDGERVVMMLDEVGIQAATGSACSALSDKSSHVVKALGRSKDEANATLRFSFGRPTTEADIDYLAEKLPSIIEQARQLN